MLRTDDIQGARPNKFKHSHRRHNYELSQYSPAFEKSYFNKSFRTLVDHDLYDNPQIASKITNAPAPDKRKANILESIQNQSHIKEKSVNYEQLPNIYATGSPKNTNFRINEALPVDMYYVDPTANGYQPTAYVNQGRDSQLENRGFVGNQGYGMQDAIDTLKTEITVKRDMNSPTSQLKKTLNGFYGVEPSPSKNPKYHKAHNMSVGYMSPVQHPAQDSFSDALAREAIHNDQRTIFQSSKGYGAGVRYRNDKDERRMDQSFGGHWHSQYYQMNPNEAASGDGSFLLDPITHKKTLRHVVTLPESPLKKITFRSGVNSPHYRVF